MTERVRDRGISAALATPGVPRLALRRQLCPRASARGQMAVRQRAKIQRGADGLR